ncbi:TonB-dependent hemoglobin/transferrin/lactoferrin family receptor [Ensifer sp. ENS06]|jgi:hemoglobin/transferrin/lactoferrin receptor protein|uniref:TonB-dependent receptor n=1 Tax=Ensifer TaxID=106591 RepID=UPI001785875E|nr:MULTISPECIES: TonB-dependent receptor [Ensifer]MBD9523024.1 TonB-dependent hemoglobin/transferrin/lactoferrin family receptor [Ensifer sp. ENS02]MBD9624395.1 TonB-dependent hemoglobin/transferrin/lactoferrin family receptor [Ensifer sp. ENS06]
MSYWNTTGRRRQSGILSLLMAGTVFALTTTVALAQAAVRNHVDVPAGKLTTAVNRLASQLKLQVVFDSSVASGVTTPGLSGDMTAEEALARLLSGTGVRYRFVGSSTVKLMGAVEAATPADGEGTKLAPIVARGDAKDGDRAPNIAVLDAEDIEKAQASSLPELLQKTPGVSMGGGVRIEGQTLAIRGFARQSDVRIILDGAPKNFEKYDQGTVFIEPELLKRVEIEKGATSVRYGNGGFGGTVLMETKDAADMLRPGEEWGVWAKSGFQSANKQFLETGALYGKSDFGGPITYDGLLAGTWRKSDDMRVGGGEVYNYSNSKLTTLLANVGAAYDGHEIRGTVAYGQNDNWGPVAAIRGQSAPSDYNITRYGYKEAMRRLLTWREIEDFTSTLTYSYTGDSDLVNYRMMGSFSSTSQHAKRPDIPGLNPSASVGGYENDATYTDIKFEAENTSNFTLGGLSHSLNYGIQYLDHDRDIWMYDITNRTQAQYNYGYYAPWFMPEGSQKTFAAFVRDRIELTDTFAVTPGLRYDHVRSKGVPNEAPRFNNPLAGHDYSAVSHQGVTPAISLSWEATPSVRFFADWAYAMRVPNIDEIYSTQSVLTKASGTSRDLEVERNSTFNIGVDLSFNDVLTTDDMLSTRISVYNNHVSNPVTRRFGTANLADVTGNVPFYWNTPSYDIRGIEWQAHYETERMFADLGVSWMTGERTGAVNNVWGPDTYINDLAPLTVIATAGIKVPDQDLAFGWTGTFVDDQNRTPYNQGGQTYARPPSAGYAVHGLFLDWTPTSGFMEGGEVHLAVDNIFDKYYEPYLSDGISAMPGRNFKIAISRKF